MHVSILRSKSYLIFIVQLVYFYTRENYLRSGKKFSEIQVLIFFRSRFSSCNFAITFFFHVESLYKTISRQHKSWVFKYR